MFFTSLSINVFNGSIYLLATKRDVDISGLLLYCTFPLELLDAHTPAYSPHFYSSIKFIQKASLKKRCWLDPIVADHSTSPRQRRLLRGNRALWIVHSVNVFMHFSGDSTQLPKSHHDLWWLQIKVYKVLLSLNLSYNTLKYIWY